MYCCSMLSEKEATRISKFLSLVLRHQPELIGLNLDEQGWTPVPELLEKLRQQNIVIDHTALQQIVATNNKKRFAFNEDQTQIRASQGHSVGVSLDYHPTIPPAVLYHGTAEKNLPSILQHGLKKQSRHHVHLSADKETAVNVGRRHGKPVVLEVKAADMHRDGCQFFVSANGVWLTDQVLPNYLQVSTNDES
jgi:putative RNA 2'-phosphotransferase